MNVVVLLGNLTKDPQLRTTPSGAQVASFTIACQRPFKGQNGEQGADFIQCIAWRQQADFVSRYFQKGSRICVEGSIRTRTYDDAQGQRHYMTEVECNRIEFASSKGSGSAPAAGAPAAPRAAAPSKPAAPPPPSNPIDDIFEDDVDTDFQPLDDSELPF